MAFNNQIRNDDLLGPIFLSAIALDAWPNHLTKMCDFWSATLLRTGRYDGRPLPPHLAIRGLEEHHFRRWLTLFKATVRQVCTAEIASLFMDRALRIAHSFRLAIAFSRGESSLDVLPILEESLYAKWPSDWPSSTARATAMWCPVFALEQRRGEWTVFIESSVCEGTER